MGKYIIDRIESKWAIAECEDRTMKHIPLTELPENIKEGDVIVLEDSIYQIDSQETQKRRAEVLKLQKKLFKK